MRGLRKVLTPFAPDQSGAESVLYELGGIVVILDAGGCAGNICGFDEPRWSFRKSAVFSAGLRDMDAVMGRDKLLVKKICRCARKIDASFVAVIGTPVPAVIGTDLHAVKRMIEAQLSLPVLPIATDGMHLYDRGVEMAYGALLRALDSRGLLGEAETAAPPDGEAGLSGGTAGRGSRRAGVFGVTPLDLPDEKSAEQIRQALRWEGFDEVILYGHGAVLQDYESADENEVNIAASLDGIPAVRFLNERFGTPYEVRFPGAELVLQRAWMAEKSTGTGCSAPAGGRPAALRAGTGQGEWPASGIRTGRSMRAGKDAQTGERSCTLIVHSQVLGNTLREMIWRREPGRKVVVASWFEMDGGLSLPEDVWLKEEDDFTALVSALKPGLIIADRAMKGLIPEYDGTFLHLPQFAVSGKREVLV